jgi:hypothetical protein
MVNYDYKNLPRLFDRCSYAVPHPYSVKLFSKTSLFGATSAKISAWKCYTLPPHSAMHPAAARP